MAHVDAARPTERNYAGIVEIPIVATEHVGIAALGGLHHIEIVRIAQRSMVRVIEYHRLAHLLSELRIVVEFALGQSMKFL
jgi:hypothetical protein